MSEREEAETPATRTWRRLVEANDLLAAAGAAGSNAAYLQGLFLVRHRTDQFLKCLVDLIEAGDMP